MNFSDQFENETIEAVVHEDDTSAFINRVLYLLDGPTCLVISLIGICSNLLSLCLLARQRVQRNFHLLMMFLSTWDLMYLVFHLVCFTLPLLSQTYREHIKVLVIPIVLPLAQISLSGSCYSTVALTIERYFAVCSPFFRLRHNIKARMYILPILFFVPLYNLPRFLEFTTIYKTEAVCSENSMDTGDNLIDGGATEEDFERRISESNQRGSLRGNENSSNCDGGTLINTTKPELDVTDFRKNTTYISIYVNFLNFLVNLIIPTLLLCVLNWKVYLALRGKSEQKYTWVNKRNGCSQLKKGEREEDEKLGMISYINDNNKEVNKLNNGPADHHKNQNNQFKGRTKTTSFTIKNNKNTPGGFTNGNQNGRSSVQRSWSTKYQLRRQFSQVGGEQGNKADNTETLPRPLELRRNGVAKDELRKRDIRLTRIAIIIVCIFIVCHLPRFLPNVIEWVLSYTPEHKIYGLLVSINNVLQTINCSVNFIIYNSHCWIRRKSEKSKNGKTEETQLHNGKKKGKMVSTSIIMKKRLWKSERNRSEGIEENQQEEQIISLTGNALVKNKSKGRMLDKTASI